MYKNVICDTGNKQRGQTGIAVFFYVIEVKLVSIQNKLVI